MTLFERNIRGVKRRRPDDKQQEEDKEAKLRRKLYHVLRELRKVVKKAKAFEVQKTVKKLKDARHKDPTSNMTKELEAQMEVLKHLSYDQLALSAFMTKLRKDKTLSVDPAIQTVSVELASDLVSPGQLGTPMAKVQSRILSSKVLASEILSVMESLRTFLQPATELEGMGEVVDGSRSSPNASKKRRTGSGHAKEALLTMEDKVNPASRGSDGGHENTSGDEAIAKVDDGWESGTVGAPSESDDSVAGDHYSSPDEDSLEDPKNTESQLHGSKGLSEFLPSLSVGFARGDSGSKFNDSETRLVDEIKKNRRGQRARRAIWEKKFGKNANHIKKQYQDTEHRRPGSVPADRRSGRGDSISRPRRIPTLSPIHMGRERVRRPTPKPEHAGNLGSTRGRSERSRRKGDLRSERPLHPSWEAKKKQKSASIVPSRGTKIVFSELQ